MKVPIGWLREHVEAPEDPRRIGEDFTRVGFALDGIEGEGDDAVLDLDVGTNRVDAMNVYGLARELAVAHGCPLRPLDLSFTESGPPAEKVLDVTIEAPELCPRFCARVLDLRVGPSPAWLRDRLEKAGVRPIHNVVDLTNYVMLEMGHPSHAFDLARIPSGRLRIRWAREGERLTTLDGVARSLGAGIGVVAGPEEGLGLAGIMGGASSEVSDETRAVALEAAYWEPLIIRRASKALGMHTEASHRFERGADPEGPVAATARIAHLLQKIGAGTTRPGLIDRVASPRRRRTIVLRGARVDALLGTQVPASRCEAILGGLGFGLSPSGENAWRAEVPTWRGDVVGEADLVEEVGRHYGLDRIPSALPPSLEVGRLGPGPRQERVIREVLVGAGLNEVIQYSFVDPGASDDGLKLANPISDQQSVLRTSLVRPGLLDALETNVRQGRRDVALFEIGRVFFGDGKLPREERHLGLLLSGAFRPSHWSEAARPADVFDAKGILEGLTTRLGLPPPRLDPAGERPELLHPGQSAAVVLEERTIGWMGTLRPGVREGRESVVVAEIVLDALVSRTTLPERFQPLPRFPAVERDLSVVSAVGTPAGDVVGEVRRAAGDLLRDVEVKDRYERPPVPAGKVSVTLCLRYQHPERTLTGEEVQHSVENVVRALRAAGRDIRGE
jgi:phenylalanyl-tRNA synthetase beta chain